MSTTSKTADVETLRDNLQLVVRELRDNSHDTQQYETEIGEVIADLEDTIEYEPEKFYGGAITRAVQRVSGIKSSIPPEVREEVAELELDEMDWENA